MKWLYHPELDSITLTGVLYALGDPVRLEIVKKLSIEGELPCGAFEYCCPARSTLSHHFRILREAGVLQTRKDGTQHINSLRKEDLDQRLPKLLDTILAIDSV